MFNKIRRLIIISLLLNILVLQYANAKSVTIRGASTYGQEVHPAIVNIDMSTIALPEKWQPGDPIKEIPMVNHRVKDSPFSTGAERGFGIDPLAIKQQLNQNNFGPSGFGNTIINVDGASFTGVNPSDTNGDIGNDFYVQSINNSSSSIILILNKSDGSTATQFVLDALATGSGTGCGAGRGDPVIFFDQLAANGIGEPKGKWILTEFTSNSFCVYVSQTSDPTSGSWFVYEFLSNSGGLPDYPKFGNWSDAYYIGANEAPTNYALDKANMIIGAVARPAQFFIGTGLPGFGFQHFMPADTDGATEPVAGAPGIFMRHRDGDYHDNGNLPDVLEMYEFHVDWDNAANSTFTGPINIPVSEFDTNLGGTEFGDLSVVQPSGTNLFPLKQPLMWRLQHRTIADKQYIVGNMVTDVDGNDLHGVRWFQLERPATTTIGGWSLADEGTYALGDTVNRWMASTAMDGDGNIAIGYNVSDLTTFPGMRYAGRLASDPPGTMSNGEHSIIEGTASNSSFRWGDYSSLNVDPVDECTFWYTAQYNTSGNWSTRIASFRFNECGDPGFAFSTVDQQQQVCVEGSGDGFVANLGVASINGFTNDVTIAFNPTLPTGFTGAFSNNPVVPPGDTDITVDVDQTVAAGNYVLTVEGTTIGAVNRTQQFSVDVFNAAPIAANLTSPLDAEQNVVSNTVTFDWDDIPSTSLYVFELATDAVFSNIIVNQMTTESTHTVSNILNSSTDYFWRVTGTNLCGNGTVSAVFSFTTAPLPGDCPIDKVPVKFVNFTFENGDQGWVSASAEGANTWTLSTANPVAGSSQHWHVDDQTTTSDSSLTSPVAVLPSDRSPLSFHFQNAQNLESRTAGGCWDGGMLEISVDGGAFTQVDNSLLGTDPYDGALNAGPLNGSQAWCGDPQDYLKSIVDITTLAGSAAQFRFRLSTDGSVGRPGWDIDDIFIQGCADDLIFAQGFEELK